MALEFPRTHLEQGSYAILSANLPLQARVVTTDNQFTSLL